MPIAIVRLIAVRWRLQMLAGLPARSAAAARAGRLVTSAVWVRANAVFSAP
jgi:hypothetical protein